MTAAFKFADMIDKHLGPAIEPANRLHTRRASSSRAISEISMIA
jgi:hypothetical protein